MARTRIWKEKDSWHFYKYYKSDPFKFLEDSHTNNPIRAVAVEGQGSYELISIDPRTNSKDIYIKLADRAEAELRRKGLPHNINLTTDSRDSEAETAFEKDLLKYIKTLKATLGEKFTTANLPKIDTANKADKETWNKYVASALFPKQGLSNAYSLVAIGEDGKKTKTWEKFIYDIQKRAETGKAGQEAASAGFVFEYASTRVAQRMVGSARNSVFKTIRGAAQKGTSSIVPKDNFNEALLISKDNKEVRSTTTTDLILEYRESINGKETSGDISISIKLAKDLYKIKYKDFSAESGDFFTKIAQWSRLSKMYVSWAYDNRLLFNQGGDFGYYLAATFASIAMGGYKEDRALYLLKSNGAEVKIKSLDVALREMGSSSSARIAIRSFKVRNQRDFNFNAKVIAGIDETSDIFSISNKLKDINLNYKLQTLGKMVE